MSSLKYKTNSIKDDYKISNKVLGVGINGKVVECEHINTKEKFALKILRDVPKAKLEAELHSLGCNHQNIVKIYEVYENTYNGIACLFLVMECMSGGELFTRIQDRAVAAFNEREASNITHSICSAVAYLHRLNIAHRDIKPENLLYSDTTDDALLKLTDFGFAKRAAAEDEKVLATPLYTPYYSSPETLRLSAFFSTHGLPISPGMKSRIRAGQYNFSGPEWDRVSHAAKDFIRQCLITDPAERATIVQLMSHKWITHYNKNPIIPLATSQVLREEHDNWPELSEEMECALASMRVDDCHIKQIREANNKLLEKRKKTSAAQTHKSSK